MLALTVVSLLCSCLFTVARASSCIAMDADFNLLVFGVNGKDFNAGTQDAWTSSTPAADITTSGRPPFDGANTTCFLAQFFNSIYALSADASNPTAVYIYDAKAKSWSMQKVSTPTGSPAFDPSDFKAILDHDTNVFYALSGGEMFFLDMGSQTSANSQASTWQDVGSAKFNTQGYDPVMALAQNHIHFLDVPGLPDGQADIFVIHFSFFQPTPQAYPLTTGGTFPQQHGQTASFFLSSGVQEEFAYIPDDGTATFVINVQTNTTQSLAAPETDAGAQYFAGITSLVQLHSNGALNFLPYQAGNAAANKAAEWTPITSVPILSSSSGLGSGSSSSGASTGTQSANAPNQSQNNNGGAAGAGSNPGSSGSGSASPNSARSESFVSMSGCLLTLTITAFAGLFIC